MQLLDQSPELGLAITADFAAMGVGDRVMRHERTNSGTNGLELEHEVSASRAQDEQHALTFSTDAIERPANALGVTTKTLRRRVTQRQRELFRTLGGKREPTVADLEVRALRSVF